MDQYVIITVYSDLFCSKGPKSYFICLNIMYIVYDMMLRLQVKVNKTTDLSDRSQYDTHFRNKHPYGHIMTS